jgi:hypothetical protein
MGLYELFSSASPANRFKIKFVEAINFLSTFSFGELKISDNTAKLKIHANFEELKDIARGINDPLNEHFNLYMDVRGTHLSVGAALIAMENLIHLAFNGNRISKGVNNDVFSNAIVEASNNYSGISKVNKIINS